MPRVPTPYSGFSYEPLNEDVENLLAHFQDTDSIRYKTFLAIWRDMKFSEIFFGINHPTEMKKFCRLSLATAVKYFLPPYSYQIRAGGLYLMFAFFHTQLAVPPVRIRLPLKHWDHVQAFLRDSLDSKHYDVIYIFKLLVSVKAFHYTAMPNFLCFQKRHKTKTEPPVTEFLMRSTAVQEVMPTDVLDEITNIHNYYGKLKKNIKEVTSKVNMAQPDLALHVQQCVYEFLSWQEKTFSQNTRKSKQADYEGEDAESAGEESSRRAMLLSSIKQKSYCNFQETSRYRGHQHMEELVDSSNSGSEQVQESLVPLPKRRKPSSLRARTFKNLGEIKEDKVDQSWLHVVPEEMEDVLNEKRLNQSAS